MFLNNVLETAPVPPAGFEQRASASASNPLDEIDSVFRRTASRVWLGVVGALVVGGWWLNGS